MKRLDTAVEFIRMTRAVAAMASRPDTNDEGGVFGIVQKLFRCAPRHFVEGAFQIGVANFRSLATFPSRPPCGTKNAGSIASANYSVPMPRPHIADIASAPGQRRRIFNALPRSHKPAIV